LEEATVMFRKKYERPGEAEANDTQRIKYAKGVLQSTKFEYVAPGKVSPVVTGRFGEMRSTGKHGGSDLAVDEGTPLRAISDGKIVESGYESGWGNYTVFTDKNGIYHLYGHMRGRGRNSGNIKKGDIIGYVGMTGRTSGPHLHWETGTGWNGTITDSFDPLKRYSINAPFNTQKESVQKTDKNKPSDIFNWQSSVSPSQSSAVASLNRSGVLKEDTSTMIFNNNAVAILPIEVAAGVA
jgi:murein DD-endopeptidase MepM/ murein hydrolase activator NlpD